ncbi:hypothetical protein GCM10027360_85730 [Amycolatopsis echigonensis]
MWHWGALSRTGAQAVLATSRQLIGSGSLPDMLAELPDVSSGRAPHVNQPSTKRGQPIGQPPVRGPAPPTRQPAPRHDPAASTHDKARAVARALS